MAPKFLSIDTCPTQKAKNKLELREKERDVFLGVGKGFVGSKL